MFAMIVLTLATSTPLAILDDRYGTEAECVRAGVSHVLNQKSAIFSFQCVPADYVDEALGEAA